MKSIGRIFFDQHTEKYEVVLDRNIQGVSDMSKIYVCEETKWKEIKTAPVKKLILIWVVNGYTHDHVKTGFVDDCGGVYSVFSDSESAGHTKEEYCTHWMPLPEPPK